MLKQLLEHLKNAKSLIERARILAEIKAYVMMTGPRGGKYYHTHTGYRVYRPLSKKTQKKPKGIKLTKPAAPVKALPDVSAFGFAGQVQYGTAAHAISNLDAEAREVIKDFETARKQHKSDQRFTVRNFSKAIEAIDGMAKKHAPTAREPYRRAAATARSQLQAWKQMDPSDALLSKKGQETFTKMATGLKKFLQDSPEAAEWANLGIKNWEPYKNVDSAFFRMRRNARPPYTGEQATAGHAVLKGAAKAKDKPESFKLSHAKDSETKQLHRAIAALGQSLQGAWEGGKEGDFQRNAKKFQQALGSLVSAAAPAIKRKTQGKEPPASGTAVVEPPKEEPPKEEPPKEEPPKEEPPKEEPPKEEPPKEEPPKEAPLEGTPKKFKAGDQEHEITLPDLAGSTKQVSWAKDIRDKAIQTVLDRVASTPDLSSDSQDAIRSDLQSRVQKRKHSKDWIDTRGENLFAKIQGKLGSDTSGGKKTTIATAYASVDVDLPALSGTPKQVDWAEQIRRRSVRQLLDTLVSSPEDAEWLDKIKAQPDQGDYGWITKALQRVLRNRDTAQMWIDNRHESFSDLVYAIAQKMKEEGK